MTSSEPCLVCCGAQAGERPSGCERYCVKSEPGTLGPHRLQTIVGHQQLRLHRSTTGLRAFLRTGYVVNGNVGCFADSCEDAAAQNCSLLPVPLRRWRCRATPWSHDRALEFRWLCRPRNGWRSAGRPWCIACSSYYGSSTARRSDHRAKCLRRRDWRNGPDRQALSARRQSLSPLQGPCSASLL